MENYRANTRFTDIFQELLTRGLQSWLHECVSRVTFEGMYQYVETSVMELFSKSSFNFTHDAKRWLAQQLYLSIEYSGGVITSDESSLKSVPKIFDDVNIKTIPTDELLRLGGLCSNCKFSYLIANELHRRG